MAKMCSMLACAVVVALPATTHAGLFDCFKSKGSYGGSHGSYGGSHGSYGSSYGSYGSGWYGGGSYGSYGSAAKYGSYGSGWYGGGSYGSYGSAAKYGSYGSSYGGGSVGGGYTTYYGSAGSHGSYGGSHGATTYHGSCGSSGGAYYPSHGHGHSGHGDHDHSGHEHAPKTDSAPEPPATAPPATDPPAPGTTSVDRLRAQVVMNVPEGAAIFVQGQRTAGTGTVRKFVSPVLVPGQLYRYEVRVEIERDGQKVVETTTARVVAGETTTLTWSISDVNPEVLVAEVRNPTLR